MSHPRYSLRNNMGDFFWFHMDTSGVPTQIVVQFVNPRPNIEALGFQIPETLARDIANETVDVSVDFENSRITFKNGRGVILSPPVARRLWETLVVMGWERDQ